MNAEVPIMSKYKKMHWLTHAWYQFLGCANGTLPYIVPHYGTTFSNRIKIEEEGQAEMYVWRIQRLAQDHTEAKYEGSHSWLKSPLGPTAATNQDMPFVHCTENRGQSNTECANMQNQNLACRSNWPSSRWRSAVRLDLHDERWGFQGAPDDKSKPPPNAVWTFSAHVNAKLSQRSSMLVVIRS